MRTLSKFLFGILMITNLCLTSCTETSMDDFGREATEEVATEGDDNKKPIPPDED